MALLLGEQVDCCNVFKWAGHVFRFATYGRTRLTHLVMCHRNYQPIFHQSISWNGDLSGRYQQHCRHVRVWRWEYWLCRTIGLLWQELANNRETWNQLDEETLPHHTSP